MIKSDFSVKGPGLERIRQSIRELTDREVLVGIPASTTDRKPEPGDTQLPPTNAVLGYVHEFGEPEHNIPARPFLIPGIHDAVKPIAARMGKVARAVLTLTSQTVDQQFNSIGLIAQNSVRRKLTEGPFVPLSDRTVAARARKGREGAMWELAWRQAGAPAGTDLAKPLIDTGQLRNSITYVVRKRKARRK